MSFQSVVYPTDGAYGGGEGQDDAEVCLCLCVSVSGVLLSVGMRGCDLFLLSHVPFSAWALQPSLAARYLEKKTRRWFDFFGPPPHPSCFPGLTRD